MMKGIQWVLLPVILLALSGFAYVSYQFPRASKGVEVVTSRKQEEALVFLSAERLEQGDTLLIRVRREAAPEKPTGTFGSRKFYFFRSDESADWVAISGVDAKADPGKYPLVLHFAENEFRRALEIKKRPFPVTELKVTEELRRQGFTPTKIVRDIGKKENPSLKPVLAVLTPKAYFSRPFIRPLSGIKIGGEFGNIRKSASAILQHLGVDLEAKTGTPVFAVNDGVVAFSETLTNYGKTLLIDHGFGIYSLYLHLDAFKVPRGKSVARGEPIALSGNTGYSVTPHLHFSVKINGASVDPLRFIETVENSFTRE